MMGVLLIIGLPVKDVERERWIGLFENSTDRLNAIDNALKCGTNNCRYKRKRRIDIILGENDGPESWVELKSWAAQSETGSGRYKFEQERGGSSKQFKKWAFEGQAKGKTAFHRQFSLDRAANKLNRVWLTQTETGEGPNLRKSVGTSEITWYFQAFKTRNRNTNAIEISPLLGSISEEGKIRHFLSEVPKGSDTIRDFSFGTNSNVANRVKLATTTELMAGLVRTSFDDLVSEAIEEVVDID